jgi:hypothetical protein
MRIVRAALVGATLGLFSCGGSSSESPWPVEPLDAVRGPKGELLPGREAADVAPSAAAEDELPPEPASEQEPAAPAGEGGGRSSSGAR